MGGLFGGTTISTEAQRLGGVQVQTSAYGLVMTVLFGQNRVPANLLYLTDFRAIPHTTTTRSGGKGGGVSQENTTFTYECCVMFGVLAGQASAFGRFWSDKDVYTVSQWTNWTRSLGAYGQAVWSFLTSNHPTEADPYSGICWVAIAAYNMGSSGTLRNSSFEMTGFNPINLGTNNNASPADIVKGILTDPYEGSGFPSALLANLSSTSDYWKYTAAQGLLFSPAYTEQAPAREHIEVILEASNSNAVWSGGVLKIVPYADSNVSGSSSGTLVNYTANVTPLYNLTDDDFIANPGEDPVRLIRKPPSDAYNYVEIEFKNKAIDYNTDIIPADDQANIEQFGLRKSDPVPWHFITERTTAAVAGQLKLQRGLYVRNVYEFRLGWRYALLEPMDLVTLTDSNLGLAQTTVRILEIEEDDNGTLTIRAEEWPLGVATPALFSTASGTGYAPNQFADPGNANAPVIFEPPLAMTNGTPQIFLGTSGGADWGGCEIWCSQDGTTYEQIGQIFKGCRHGVLTALYSGGTMKVDLSVSGGSMTSASTSDANAMLAPIYADGELMSYTTATLTGPNAYDLTTQNRGAYGTAVGNHASATKFMRVDEAIARINTPAGTVGKTISIKLRSFNLFGNNLQDLSVLSPYTYTVTGGSTGGVATAMAKPTSVTIASTTAKP